MLNVLIFSALAIVLGPISSVSAATAAGEITGMETWSGTHTVTGDILIRTGAQVTIQPGTTVSMANGSSITVQGNLCIASTCASQPASAGTSHVRFIWQAPANPEAYGECYGKILSRAGTASKQVWYRDPSCGEGIILENSIDRSISIFENVTFQNAYGIPFLTKDGTIHSAALVLSGPSVDLRNIEFNQINTSNLLATDNTVANIVNSKFSVGVDENDADRGAIIAYNSGGITPFSISYSSFEGTGRGCGQGSNARSVLWSELSYVQLVGNQIPGGDYGFSFKESTGIVRENNFQVTCNGIDLMGQKLLNQVPSAMEIRENTFNSQQGSPVTAYDNAFAVIDSNKMEGAEQGSGVQVKKSIVRISNNVIGPISGFNGIWVLGQSEVVIDNNTLTGISKEPILLNEYQFRSQNAPDPKYALIENNVIDDVQGTCSGSTLTGVDEYPCPAIMVYMAAATILDNTISNTVTGIDVRGGIVDVRRNNISATGSAFLVRHYDNKDSRVAGASPNDEFAALGYFENNDLSSQAPSQAYNVTKSRVLVQSEFVPATIGQPIRLSWEGYENENVSLWPSLLPYVPASFPMDVRVQANATIFQFADLSNFDISKIQVSAGNPSPWVVQVQRSELVRMQVKINGIKVNDAAVAVKDAMGIELFNVTTDTLGFTPWISLPSDFHLDFRGNGDNPNQQVGDPGENSCSDGFDNDGDLVMDLQDPDCQGGATRELSKYNVWAYKWGVGRHDSSFTLTGFRDTTIDLSNPAPSLSVVQQDGTSFAREISVSGSAHDGTRRTTFNHDCRLLPDRCTIEQQASMGGTVERVEVQLPNTNSWIAPRYGVDTSGAPSGTGPDTVNHTNHPYSYWSFNYDMSGEQEGDYLFKFRSFDGNDYGAEVERVFKLNMEAPTVYVDTPGDGATFVAGSGSGGSSIVTFSGSATDRYSGSFGASTVDTSDISHIWIRITPPTGATEIAKTPGGRAWSWSWDFSNWASGEYIFEIWASDGDFCDRESTADCPPVELKINIQNSNKAPTPPEFETINGNPIGFSDAVEFTTGPATSISGTVTDRDGGNISRVIAEYRSKQAAVDAPWTQIYNVNPPVPPSNTWSLTWDTTSLSDAYTYDLRVRAYDEDDAASDWAMQSFVALKPGGGGINSPPTFNNTGWEGVLELMCDPYSSSSQRCGPAGEGLIIDLARFIEDPDDDRIQVRPYIPSDATSIEKARYELVKCTGNLVCVYNPSLAAGITLAEDNLADWWIEGLRFEFSDLLNDPIYSDKIDLRILEQPFVLLPSSDPVSEMGGEYRGIGLPLFEVHIIVNGLKKDETQVDKDGYWALELQRTWLGVGDNKIEFTYWRPETNIAEQMISADPIIIEGDADRSLLSIAFSEENEVISWSIIGVILLALLVIAFFAFFVEIEEDGAEPDFPDSTQQGKAQDPYAWAHQAQVSDASLPVSPASAPQEQAHTAPGWRWDPVANQWVPDDSQ